MTIQNPKSASALSVRQTFVIILHTSSILRFLIMEKSTEYAGIAGLLLNILLVIWVGSNVVIILNSKF